MYRPKKVKKRLLVTKKVASPISGDATFLFIRFQSNLYRLVL